MRLSDLIKQANELLAARGDLEVVMEWTDETRSADRLVETYQVGSHKHVVQLLPKYE